MIRSDEKQIFGPKNINTLSIKWLLEKFGIKKIFALVLIKLSLNWKKPIDRKV